MPVHPIKENLPNALSITRYLITFSILVLYFVPHPILAAQVLIISGVVSDKLDGTLARLWKTESDLGKRLESIVDPFFGFVSAVYCVIFLGLPFWAFVIGSAALIAGSLGRVVVKMMTGKMFYVKSQITRLGVGLVFVIVILYVLQVQKLEWVVWPTVIYGMLATLNYFRMMVKFIKENPRSARFS